MELNKQKIQRAFNRAGLSYDRVATVQKRCAEELIVKLGEKFPHFTPASILDIGTGTGFIPELLLPLFPQSRYYLNDMAEVMLERTQRKWQTFENFHFMLGDMEDLDFKNSDLIISNLAFQWANTLTLSLEKFYNKSKVFAFSYLLSGTFREWADAFQKASFLPPTYPYSSEEELKSFLLSLNPKIYSFEVKEFEVVFDSALAFIRYLKSLGATVSIQDVSLLQLRKLLKTHNQEFRTTYKVFFGILER